MSKRHMHDCYKLTITALINIAMDNITIHAAHSENTSLGKLSSLYTFKFQVKYFVTHIHTHKFIYGPIHIFFLGRSLNL